MILLTGVIHTVLTLVVVRYVRTRVKSSSNDSILKSVLKIDFIILAIITATVLETSIWAAGFMYFGALSEFEESLYFSIITYTTLGYGDIILDNQWRLLASLEATNGVIMFGWSTSLLILVIQNTVLNKKKSS